jgi:hypothetical protein
LTMTSSWMVGNKNTAGWIVALCNQVLWFTWIWASRNYGFVPLGIMLTIIYARNYRAWSRA